MKTREGIETYSRRTRTKKHDHGNVPGMSALVVVDTTSTARLR